ncbi:hypothetical protein JW865_02565 [Candidatus Bathyarchaeota archaeon]|nr:hypothetical protein [Candidatus Bathyarchaeota archaeon]
MIPQLNKNPIPYLLNSGIAINYFTKRDLLNESVDNIKKIWVLPEVKKLLKNQNRDGSWGKEGGYPLYHNKLIETFKRFRLLIERYELNNNHHQIASCSEFIFNTQTLEGDFRGFIGDQYATYYTGEVTALLIKAGYIDDIRIELAFRWLLSIRQNDGGWIVPILTRPPGGGIKRLISLTSSPADPIEPDKTRPFSHNCTDMVLRAFAAHPKWRKNPSALHAANLLKSRFFKEDAYNSYKNKNYWVRFIHWWPNLITSLESLIQFGFQADDPDVQKALQWFKEHQEEDGSWHTSYFPNNKISKKSEILEKSWVTLRITKIFNSFKSI